MKVEYINPFITTTVNVFATMLSCTITRVGLKVKERLQPEHEISGIIGLSGRAAGTVVLSLSRNVALSAASAMIGEEQNEINDDVADVIGELANMVAGGAKAQLTELEMSVSLPSVIIGKNHIIMGSSKVQALSVLFSSAWGPLNVDVSLLESTQLATNITLD
jgi:chemotaxis protein CheX